MRLYLSPMEHTSALEIATWRYPPPYDFYNSLDQPASLAEYLIDPDNRFFQLQDGSGVLVGYCCFGTEAQVPGGDYSAPAIDIGIGVRPDLTGRGEGMQYLQPVLEFARQLAPNRPMRLSVARFNQRAIRLYTKAGFRETQRFYMLYSGREFVVMVRT